MKSAAANEVRATYGAMAVISFSMLSAAVARVILSPLQELARGDLNLDLNQMGFVQGLALALPIALLSFPIGRLVDASNRVRLLFYLACCCTIGTVLTALANGFALLVIARMLTGLGLAGGLATAVSIAADLSVPERRGRTMMLLAGAQAVGSGLAFALGGALVETLAGHAWAAWRLSLLLIACPMAGSTLLLLLLREPVRHELGAAGNRAIGSTMREIWHLRGIVLPLMAGMMALSMADAAAMIWAVPVLVHDFGLTPQQFGNWLGLTVMISGILGVVIGGFLADIGQRWGGSAGLLAGAVAGSLLSVVAALFPVVHSVPMFAALIGLLMLCGGAVGVIAATAIAILLPNEIRGLCMTVSFAINTFVGLGIAPLVVSMLAGGNDAAAIAPALAAVGVAMSIISTLAFLITVRASFRIKTI